MKLAMTCLFRWLDALVGTKTVLDMVLAGFGLSEVLPLSATLVTASCFNFVDDTDLVHAVPSVDSSATSALLPQLQATADLWADRVMATGRTI
jgi:hypothetical protein